MRTAINSKRRYWDSLQRLREVVVLRGNDAVAHGDFSRWGFWIASAIISSQVARLCYQASSNVEQYPQLVIGQIAWRATSKSQDFNLLLGLVFGFLAALLILLLLASRIRKRIAPSAVDDFHALIVFASLPAIIWGGRLFLTRDTSSSLLTLSTRLVVLVLLFALFATVRDIISDKPGHFSDAVSSSVLIVVWTVLSGIAFVFAASRLAIVFKFRLDYPRFTLITLSAAVAFGAAFLIWAWSRRAITGEALTGQLRVFVILAQLLTPGFFLILLPTPWIKEGRRFYGYPLKPAVWFAIGLLIVIAYVDLVRRRKFRPASIESYITSALSPICLVGLLLFIKLGQVGAPTINADDYHFGEFVLPWWSWSVHHMIPFWDYAPARGLVNYVPGFLSSVLFDGTAATFGAAAPFVAAGYLLLCYLVVARSIGVFPTFLAFLLMPLANGLSEIDMLMTAALCVLCELYLRASPTTWLVAWIGVGTLSVLFAPGQGGLLVIATLPLGLIAIYKALKHERARLLKFVGALTATVVVLSIFTPLGKMLTGAVRYGIEQSSINSVANGIEWSHSWWNANGKITNLWLWESARASWILVAIVAGALTIRSAFEWQNDRRKRLLVFAIPNFTLMILFIFRAAGRIDPEAMSRLGFASIWALSLLLPILLIAANGKKRLALVLATSCFLAAIVSPYFSPLNLEGLLLNRPTEAVGAPINIAKRSDLDLANLGNGILDEGNLKRLQSIRRVLNAVVGPGETYLDLTNRGAHYFYLGHVPPIEVGAVYNLVNESQQYRAIRSLKGRPPPIIVASADSILLDGITSAYRTHLLYRYVVETYVPVRIEGLIYMVRPDRLSRVAQYIDVQEATEDESRLQLLDAVFRMDDIGAIPVAWGRSLKTLTPQLRRVQGVGSDIRPALISASDIGNGYYQIDRPHPSLTFDISTWSLSGKDAGILTFDFFCRGNTNESDIKMQVGSSATAPNDLTAVQFVAKNGPLAVPLDAAPRWLLAKRITSLSFELVDPAQCSAFSITNIKLWQRTSVDRLP